MRRRTRLVLLAGAVGLIVPAVIDSPAGAVDQDLVVSASAAPIGSAVTVSSATCVSTSEVEGSISASLYVGTAPNQQIAAFASGSAGSATFTIPDWVGPSEPAVIEATCEVFGDVEDHVVDFDPVDFDVEPGVGVPVQVRTFSRTELLAGQGLTIAGSCGPGATERYVTAVILDTADQTGRDADEALGQGAADVDSDGSFELDLIVSNAFVGFQVELGIDDDAVSVDVAEEPMDVEPGDYTVFTYCSEFEQDSLTFLEPQAITVTGAAPTGDIDLTAIGNTSEVVMAGTSAVGDVVGDLSAYANDEFIDGPVSSLRARVADPFGLSERTGDAGTNRAFGSADRAGADGVSRRSLGDEGYLEFTTTPSADGSWEVSDDVKADQAIVLGFASCGDPMADGFAYDPQGVAIDLVDDTTTTTTTTPTTTTTTPPAPPANAVPGTPNYAG